MVTRMLKSLNFNIHVCQRTKMGWSENDYHFRIRITIQFCGGNEIEIGIQRGKGNNVKFPAIKG